MKTEKNILSLNEACKYLEMDKKIVTKLRDCGLLPFRQTNMGSESKKVFSKITKFECDRFTEKVWSNDFPYNFPENQRGKILMFFAPVTILEDEATTIANEILKKLTRKACV